MKKKLKSRRGASAVEFAIVLPVLLMLIFGIAEFGILMYDKAVITNASREGARAGIVYSFPNRLSEDEIRSVVNSYCSSYLITFGASATPSTTVTLGTDPGDPLTVNVTYPYSFLVLPNFVAGLAGGLTLAATTVMRME